MARIYATPLEVGAVGVEASADQCRRASLAVDTALIGAWYDTDDDGMPTDAAVLEAVKQAAIAQCRAIIANEATDQPLKSASIGGASYTYADRADSGLTLPTGGGLCADAANELRVAGVLPVGVVSYG